MATFAEQMGEKLQAILLANAGLASGSVDGTMVAQKDLDRRRKTDFQHGPPGAKVSRQRLLNATACGLIIVLFS